MEDYMFIDSVFLPVYTSDPNFQVYPFQMKGVPAKRKILIVDDDTEISELIKNALLEEHRFDVKIASDPFEAINMMMDEVYDFVLLDWNLPRMNGAKTIQEAEKIFRHDPTLPLDWESRRVGVLTFSAEADKTCKLASTQHFKYIGHISKQNRLQSIVDTIQSYMDRTSATAQ
jgi:PleD family two-component response regulator